MKFSFIYIFTDGENVKVGLSNNITKRIKQLQTGCPKKISLVASYKVFYDSRFSFEKICHKEITSRYAKRGEWFIGCDQKIIKFLIDSKYDQYLHQIKNPELLLD